MKTNCTPSLSAIFETLGQFVATAEEKIEALQAASEVCTAGLEVEAELQRTGHFVSVGAGMMRVGPARSQPGFYGGRG